MVQQILRFLRQFESRQLYFWLGFLAGGLFFWILSRLRVLLPKARAALKNQILEARQSFATSTETRLRNDILRMAQRMHLAAPLFALDEIVIPPRLLAPPPSPLEEGASPVEGGIDSILPYLPDWPELAAACHAPVLSLTEALSGGANLILTGAPGSGKTVALAYLASQMIRRICGTGDFAEKLPLLVHTADLHLDGEPLQDCLAPLIAAVAQRASTLTQPRLPAVIRSAFERGSVLLLLDGMDEMPPGIIPQVTTYLQKVLETYPQVRIIATASMDNYDGLVRLGMVPVAIAAWNDLDKAAFIRQWGDAWHSYISPGLPATEREVDPLLLNEWLQAPDPALTPLELTLKTWAAYAGDISGPTAPGAIEAYLNRMTVGIPDARPVLEKLASHMVIGLCPCIDIKEALKWVPDPTPALPVAGEAATALDQGNFTEEGVRQFPTGENSPLPIAPAQASIPGKPASQGLSAVQQTIYKLIDSGVLVTRPDSRINFIHPVIAAYLAGTAIASLGELENLNGHPDWTGKAITLGYLSTWNDLTPLVQPVFMEKEDPLFRKPLAICRWLRDTSKGARWRSIAMRYLAGLIPKESLPLGVRTRAMVALVFTGDPGVPVLLHSLLSNPADNVRLLAALGCGLAKDAKSVKDLIVLLGEKNPTVSAAAMLALAAIGTPDALDAIAHALLHGTEEIRRAAAEALATLPEEGHPALSEGATMPDLLVRRAVVFGLARVNQPWANQILEKMQIEDEQWVVRNAAIQALEDMQKPNPRIPRALPPLHQVPWLIAFAGKQGIGVSPGKPVLDLLASALHSQDRKDQLSAMYILSYQEEANTAPDLYGMMSGTDPELQEAAYSTLWMKAASGVQLPPPAQFGIL